jgi:glutaconyl-CoA/methylmalonyl-CoA decarboxylase subunit gamma
MTMIYKIAIKDEQFEVEIGEIADGCAMVNVNGDDYEVTIENYEEVAAGTAPMQPLRIQPAPQFAPGVTPAAPPRPSRPQAPTPAAPAPVQKPSASQNPGSIVAPIPGRIMSIKVQVGDSVKTGQTLATMEAMKMENNIVSTADGTVKEILVQQGAELATGDVIMVIG